MTPFSLAAPTGADPYGFAQSPAYMGQGSTGGAQPGQPSAGLLGALQPFLQRMQQNQQMAARMAPPVPKLQPPQQQGQDANGNPASPTAGGAAPAFKPGLLNGMLGAGGPNNGLLNQLFRSFSGGGSQPGMPLNILPPTP